MTFLRSLIEQSKDGEWGKGNPDEGHIAMSVIRGTDFEDVRNGNLENLPVRYIPIHIAERKALKPNDIVIETAGGSKDRPTGRTLYIKDTTLSRSELPLICASFARFIRISPSSADPQFVFWLLQYLYSSGHIKKYHTQHTGVARFQWTTFAENEPLDLPTPDHQHKIASILSAYDDLIENNTRRIRILEQIARDLYQEWFVHFRFPHCDEIGWKQTDTGRVPSSWERTKLGQLLLKLDSGKRPKGGVGNLSDGVPSIGAENINGVGNHDFTREKYVSREFFESMTKGVIENGDVGLYKDGAYIGRSNYFRDGFPHSECCVNEHVFLLRVKGDKITQNLLYLWFQQSSTVETIRLSNANAAQPGINQETVRNLEILLPDSTTAQQFDGLVEPLLAGIINLAKRNRYLQLARDLLLPRLISGELDVSELDIDVPEPTTEYGV
jgi:type I restriction enzyme S subunit